MNDPRTRRVRVTLEFDVTTRKDVLDFCPVEIIERRGPSESIVLARSKTEIIDAQEEEGASDCTAL